VIVVPIQDNGINSPLTITMNMDELGETKQNKANDVVYD